MTLRVMNELLGRVCGELRWINEGGVCGRLRATLAPAAEAEQRGQLDAARAALRAFGAELDAQHGPGKPVSDSAYWLLRVNTEYLLAHM